MPDGRASVVDDATATRVDGASGSRAGQAARRRDLSRAVGPVGPPDAGACTRARRRLTVVATRVKACVIATMGGIITAAMCGTVVVPRPSTCPSRVARPPP